MSPASLLHRLVPRFARDTHGGVAVMFAMAAVPLIGLSGAVVDYSTASRDRALLQSAADAAALQIAKTPTSTTAQAEAAVRSNFAVNYTAATSRTATVTMTKGTDQARVVASDEVPKMFRLFPGMPSTTRINVEAEVRWGTNNIEIALVLDNTGSMASSSKMDELKRALCGDTTCSNTNPSSGFVKIIKDAAIRPNQFMVGLVPFDVNVRVPQTWQSTVNSSTPINGTFAGYTGQGYCPSNSTTARASGNFRFANRDNADQLSQFYGQNSNGCTGSRPTPANWLGCVADRDQVGDLDTRDPISLVNSSDMSQRHPAVTCFAPNNTLARMMPLSDIQTSSAALITGMRAMSPSGNTNLPIGISWGTAMLTNSEPFTEARAPSDTTVRRFMILLTDGENTQSKHSWSSSSINSRTTMACDYAKQQGFTIYAIRVIDGNRTLLQNCASSPAHYKEVANASQLTPVFQQIASEIGALRLSH